VQEALAGQLGQQVLRLDLGSGELRAGGAAILAALMPNMPRLQALLIGDNGIGPQGALFLGQGMAVMNDTLQELDLSSNGLGPEGLHALAGPLRQLAHLRVLRLRFGWASSEGVDVLSQLLQPLGPKLELLDLSQNKLNASSMRSLIADFPAMPELRSLSLAENSFANIDFVAPPGTPNFLRLTKGCPVLRELDLSSIGLGSDESALRAIVSALPQTLQNLQLSAARLQDPQLQQLLEVLPPLPELESLVLMRAQMDDTAAEVLARFLTSRTLPKLRLLDIRGNPITCKGCSVLQESLRQMPSFRELRGAK